MLNFHKIEQEQADEIFMVLFDLFLGSVEEGFPFGKYDQLWDTAGENE